MAVGDVYELTLTGVMQGQPLSNVFHYEQDLSFALGPPSVAAELIIDFKEQVLSKLTDMAPADLVYNQIDCRNLFDTADNASDVFVEPGTAQSTASESLPSYAAVGYKLETGDSVVRPGGKRFAGITENSQNDGVFGDPTFLVHAEAVRVQLSAPVTVGLVIQDPVFIPVIVKRVKETNGVSVVYRMPRTQAEKIVRSIKTVLLNALVTSQISRKESVVL